MEKSGCSWEDWLLDLEVNECVGPCGKVGGWGGERQAQGHIVETECCNIPLDASTQCSWLGGSCGNGAEFEFLGRVSCIVLDKSGEEVANCVCSVFNGSCSILSGALGNDRRDQEGGGERFHKFN